MMTFSRARHSAQAAELDRLIFNDTVNFYVTGALATLALVVVISSALEWWKLLTRRRAPDLQEAPYMVSQFAEAD
jgi:hypothetical protein